MASLGLLILQNWKFNKTGTSLHGISGVAVLENWKSTKLHRVTLVKGTPGVSVLSEQQIVENCFDACPLLQFHKFHNREETL